jgi:hypothetical protein
MIRETVESASVASHVIWNWLLLVKGLDTPDVNNIIDDSFWEANRAIVICLHDLAGTSVF